MDFDELRLKVAEIFLLTNAEEQKLMSKDHPFYNVLSIEDVLNGLKNGLEPQYRSDMSNRNTDVDLGLLNLYESYIYGVTHPNDPKVTSFKPLYELILALSLKQSDKAKNSLRDYLDTD